MRVGVARNGTAIELAKAFDIPFSLKTAWCENNTTRDTSPPVPRRAWLIGLQISPAAMVGGEKVSHSKV